MRTAVVCAAIAVLAAISARGQVSESDREALSRLVGVWSLVDWEETLSDGSTRKHPVTEGRIIYTDLGEMCAVVMDPNRPHWASASPTPEEALAGMNSGVFYAYCARAEVHAAEGYALHRTFIDKIPNNVGAVRKRWFEFLGPDRIQLLIDPGELRAPVVRSQLIWERVID
jgi:Lipocalin-like domain